MVRGRAGGSWSSQHVAPVLPVVPGAECAAWANAFLQENRQVESSTLAESASFCAQHCLEAPLDALCGRAALGLGQGLVQTSDALRVAEAALQIRASDPNNQWRCNMEHGTNNLFFALQGLAAQVPFELELSDLRALVVVLLRWAMLRRSQCAPFDPRSAFAGVAVAAAPALGRASAPETEALGLAHGLANGLQLFPPMADSAEGRAVEEVLRVALGLVRKRLHRLSTEQVAEFAGAAAAAWIGTSDWLRGDVLEKCLADVGQAVRFRRSVFQVSELVAVAVALGKAGLKADVVVDVLLQRLCEKADSFSSQDLIVLARTCSHGCWPHEELTEKVVTEIRTRDLSTFSPSDLCLVAQSMAYFKDHGILANEASELLDTLAQEAQDTEVSQLTLIQKIQLLQDVARADTPHSSTCSMLVQEISCDNWVALQNDLAIGLLRTLATLWPRSQTPDGEQTLDVLDLLLRVIKLAPWMTARPDEVLSIVCALSPLPMLLDHVSQDSLSQAVLRINATPVSHDELESILVVLWKCACRDTTRMAAAVLKPFAAEASTRLTCCTDAASASSLALLAEALLKTGAAQEAHCKIQCAGGYAAGVEATAALCTQGCCPAARHTQPQKETKKAEIEINEAIRGHLRQKCRDNSCDCHSKVAIKGESSEDTNEAEARQVLVLSEHGLKAQCEEGCCPTGIERGVQVRLNRHCGFSGHCVQVKNTFIHIACENDSAHETSDSERDCVVCRRLGRSRSCDGPLEMGL